MRCSNCGARIGLEDEIVRITYGNRSDLPFKHMASGSESEAYHQECLLQDKKFEEDWSYGQKVRAVADQIYEYFSKKNGETE